MTQRILYHILFWIAYMTSQVYMEFSWILHYYEDRTQMEVFWMALTEEMSLLIVRIPMVYVGFFVSDKMIGKQNGYMKVAIFLALLLSVSTIFYRAIIVKLILKDVYLVTEPEDIFSAFRVVRALLDLMFLMSVAMGIRLYRSSIRYRERESRLMREKLETELRLLKSQVNPHFLFNTLNNIYVLALRRSEQTAPVVVKLSELLRFMLYESGEKQITLRREIKFLEDYLELEKIRYGERLNVDFEKQVEDGSVMVLPLLLLPLVENSFKHGAGENSQQTQIKMSIIQKRNELLFSISNNVEEVKSSLGNTGIGLKNVRRRLELTYSDFTFEAQHKDDLFVVSLYINLNSNEA